ncbi:MAG: pyrroline-5-carboxylate reductase [Deltaproteobacteria bacterium]|nr:pyrroline-5-carboxylate reductase [Deltaproteobacteria bacterium]
MEKMTIKETLGFIGSGNMATALIKGLIQSGAYEKEQILAADKSKDCLTKAGETFGIRCCASNLELALESAVILLAVKPQNMRDVLEEIKGKVRKDHLIISIAAGIPLKMIREILAIDLPMIRVMPNTPALIQEGASALAPGPFAGEKEMATARKIFSAVGIVVEVEEAMLDAVTALSGSGPGYVFRMMECVVEAGITVGLKPDVALKLVMQTFLGAARLAGESEHPLPELRKMVTSPGGTTAAGLGVFEESDLKGIILKAVDAACRRSVELGQ